MDKLKMHTTDLTDENIKKLAELFPNCVTESRGDDGKLKKAVDFDQLRQELSTSVVDGPRERYQLNWPGKKEALLTANAPIAKTLRPCREESVDFDTTKNLFIEGDNLDALKLLQETYLNKVKMIYIDPPYNTGNDFIYDDDFKEDTEAYFQRSNQKDEMGNRMVVNTDSNGRFHSDWLSMMYSRLKLARNLLKDNGVIFISIDDGEVHNLRKVCDDVFGSENFVAQFPWRKRTAKSDVPFGVSQDYEWIQCFAKSTQFIASVEGKGRKYYESDDLPNRPWRIHDLTKQTNASERPNSFFSMINPKNGKEYPANPNATWRITKDTFQEYYDAGRIVFPGDYDFLKISRPVFRYFKEDDMKKDGELFGKVAVSTKFPESVGMSQDGTKEITSLFEARLFSFPKPSSLIKFLTQTNTTENDIILDFFAGSATTAHAVLQLNVEDGGNRKFIMVQLPETCDEKSEAFKAGYKTIAEIGKERIRRAGKKIKEENSDKEGIENLDIGFRVLKVDSSNMKDVYYSPDTVNQDDLFDYASNIHEDRTPEDLLFQVLLDWGVDLSLPVTQETIGGKTVFFVDKNALAACFEPDISEDMVKELAARKPLRAVFRDSGFASDSVKINVEQIFKLISPGTEVKAI
ncbi:MAG TPA: site-specific DNA-methyltransferase [Nitrospirae bacterium]|nr:site-specific DNA-methyltransferase [Nitrospirota bacterium]